MSSGKNHKYIIGTLSLYFGWLLSFPFYGPVLRAAELFQPATVFPIPLIFTSAHALSLLVGGAILRQTRLWKNIMLVSLTVTIAANTVLLLPFSGIWPWMMAVLGCSSALYILGWSCPYSLSLPTTGRISIMACTIIGANVLLIIYTLLANLLPARIILAASIVPLGAALKLLVRFPVNPGEPESVPKQPSPPLPVPLLLIFCLFVAGLYLNGGFMYQIILPALNTNMPFSIYYRFIPYIIVLLVMYRFGERLQRYFPLYMGVSLLGLGFVSFALLDTNTAGFLMTSGLIETAFALLDLFVWTTLGSLAFIYRAPFPFFGFALTAMVTSIIAGDLIGEHLLPIGENHRLVTAILAAGTIFLAFTVMPWLNDHINRGFSLLIKNSEPEIHSLQTPEDPFERLLKNLPPEQNLTAREMEIIKLALTGLTNREIARLLFISANTLKTHLKHIYQKFGVPQKRELLSLAAGNELYEKP